MTLDDDAFASSLHRSLADLTPPPLPDLDGLSDRMAVIVGAAHEILGAQSVGLLLLDQDGRARAAASSGDAAERFERAQADLGIGPGIDVFAGTETIVVHRLATDDRWPGLRPFAEANGIEGVLSVPVLIGGSVVGNLNVIRDNPDGWTGEELGAAGAYAELVGMLLSLTAATDPG